ncbi:MAG: GNAT family N-acetyltransferase [Muribaculaceae bacterium]
MIMIKIEKYIPTQCAEWNKFVDETKNGTFMHKREYMDYHNSRFSDFSLIAYAGSKIIGVLPANRCDNTLYSHQGLTFAGWLTQSQHFDVSNMLQIFDAMRIFLQENGIKELIYKASPHIYHQYPADEDLYAIFRNNGTLISSNISSTVSQDTPLLFNENARRAVKSATQHGVVISETTDFAPYWKLLTETLNARHGVNPVHTLQEIELLHSRFPLNIRLFTASLGETLLGGVVVYLSINVAHAQYIAASEEGCEKKVLPLIFNQLISEDFSCAKYFDFGISNEQNGLILNEGLSMQKSGMGGRGIVYNTYKLNY